MTAPIVTSILFVCTGNICRSPLAEGVFRHLAEIHGVDDLVLDSAGLGDWHSGEAPDHRSIKIAQRHGIHIGGQICRVAAAEDFERFDLVLGMDKGHVEALNRRKPAAARASVSLYMDFCAQRRDDVGDPYYGDMAAFERCYDMIRTAADAWFAAAGGPSSRQASSTT
ncbi:MAG: low molecular weight protein-tyrosine-phosphatase [Rhizobiaceae bacterium]